MSDNITLEKTYDPRSVEPEIYALWERSGSFRSVPDPEVAAGKISEEERRKNTFTIVMPPPNVTGALHLGHALNNTLQDILTRYHRMRGFNTLWQPGTDHAGIATQAVVERRIREQEGKTRYELGATPVEARNELLRRIWEWKAQYEQRIISQLKLMGCSCDWGYKEAGANADGSTQFECDGHRTRFTMDEGLSRAVRLMFFNLFKDGLIFRGKRLVNWDTQLQTAVSDDEVYYETVKGHFYHFKYPVIRHEGTEARRHGEDNFHSQAEPEYVVIATTRPETMLGDTAVAVHPDPEGYFARQELELRTMWDRLSSRSGKDAVEIQSKLDAIAARRESHLSTLVKLRDMANAERKLKLPLVDREIPLICDEWANPMLGSGCVKITPAHDPNDYEVGVRHHLPMINVLTADGKIARIVEPDGSTNSNSSKYEGLPFSSDGRSKVVGDLASLGLVDSVEDRDIELGHSDRSKLPIEPYLSDQWFVRTGEGNKATRQEGKEAGGSLAQAAMDAVENGQIKVFPSRYAKSYLDWLGEKRDWCISRQLWWGHRIPVWGICFTSASHSSPYQNDASVLSKNIESGKAAVESYLNKCGVSNVEWRQGNELVEGLVAFFISSPSNLLSKALQLLVNLLEVRNQHDPQGTKQSELAIVQEFGDDALSPARQVAPLIARITEGRLFISQDPDVLDTWFSSALWPFSTLGWPEETPHLKQYYPGSVLCTSRDIITNWVARMVMFGLYARGRVPFDHVYVHPKILDGRGETMSKSKGNGVDPVDIIHTHGADALRYSMADLTTETQDIRMPVEYLCPHCGKLTDQGIAIKAEEQSRKSRGQKLERKLQPADCVRVKCTNKECGKEFATQWADGETKNQLGIGRETSEKFEIGRNFCNKLWNAARFAFMNLEATRQQGSEATRLGGTQAPGNSENATWRGNSNLIGSAQAEACGSLLPEDRWILAKLSQTIRNYHNCIANYQFSASVRELREFFWDCLCDWYIELTKARFSDTANPTGGIARQVLAFCLDQALRLWHPTMPFITERLWAQLNAIVASRGFPGGVEVRHDELLISAEFPPLEGYPAFDDDQILSTFANLQDATRGIREIRNNYNVHPREKIKVTIVTEASDKAVEALRNHVHIISHMANVDSADLRIVNKFVREKNSASISLKDLRIYVHDISNDAEELSRAKKSLDGVEKQIAGKKSKLDNEKFTANADPEIVAAERHRLDELLAEQAHLRQRLAELQ